MVESEEEKLGIQIDKTPIYFMLDNRFDLSSAQLLCTDSQSYFTNDIVLLVRKIIEKFDPKIPIGEFDKRIDELIKFFPKTVSVLIKLTSLNNSIYAVLKKNPDNSARERKKWDF